MLTSTADTHGQISLTPLDLKVTTHLATNLHTWLTDFSTRYNEVYERKNKGHLVSTINIAPDSLELTTSSGFVTVEGMLEDAGNGVTVCVNLIDAELKSELGLYSADCLVYGYLRGQENRFPMGSGALANELQRSFNQLWFQRSVLTGDDT